MISMPVTLPEAVSVSKPGTAAWPLASAAAWEPRTARGTGQPRVLQELPAGSPRGGKKCASENFVNLRLQQSGMRVISLGSACNVKESIRAVGMDAESMPFDWMKTRLAGILRYLQNDFVGFFDVSTRSHVPNCKDMVMYRDFYHSFWHDDLGDENCLEKYRRRIGRFQALDAESKPILFVRSVAESAELTQTQQLADALVRIFGSRAKLLVIVDFQHSVTGPVLIKGSPNVFVYCNVVAVHSTGKAPYIDAIRCALDWAMDKEITGLTLDSLEMLAARAEYVSMISVQGLDAFERSPDNPLHQSLAGQLSTRETSDVPLHSRVFAAPLLQSSSQQQCFSFLVPPPQQRPSSCPQQFSQQPQLQVQHAAACSHQRPQLQSPPIQIQQLPRQQTYPQQQHLQHLQQQQLQRHLQQHQQQLLSAQCMRSHGFPLVQKCG